MIFVDIFEPVEIETLIQQVVPTTRGPFNSHGLPDYHWIAIDGHRIGVSRKQANELMGGLDAAEEQLRKDMVSVDEMLLLVEGIFSSALMAPNFYDNSHNRATATSPIPPQGRNLQQAIQTWKLSKDYKYFYRDRKYYGSISGVYAWLDVLDKKGITTVQTAYWIDTAIVLGAIYNSSQKKEHTTLQRYIKQKITPKPHNHHVETLMGIKGTDHGPLLGETKAKALIDKFGSVWYVLLQEPEELAQVEGIGLITARKLLKAIGRTI